MLYEGVSARPTTIPLAEVRESVSGQPMSAAGQSRRFAPPPMTSGLPPEADTVTAGRHVSKVPNSDVAVAQLGSPLTLISGLMRCSSVHRSLFRLRQ
jgi:hypothetical protein